MNDGFHLSKILFFTRINISLRLRSHLFAMFIARSFIMNCMRIFVWMVLADLVSGSALMAQQAGAQRRAIVLHAARLLDIRSGKDQCRRARCWSKASALLRRDPRLERPAGAEVIDLGDSTLMPGLIDAHVHLFLHPGAEDLQTVEESVPQRTILAALAAKDDLMAGFTAERDMGTEGAGSADTAVRNAIDRGTDSGATAAHQRECHRYSRRA